MFRAWIQAHRRALLLIAGVVTPLVLVGVWFVEPRLALRTLGHTGILDGDVVDCLTNAVYEQANGADEEVQKLLVYTIIRRANLPDDPQPVCTVVRYVMHGTRPNTWLHTRRITDSMMAQTTRNTLERLVADVYAKSGTLYAPEGDLKHVRFARPKGGWKTPQNWAFFNDLVLVGTKGGIEFYRYPDRR